MKKSFIKSIEATIAILLFFSFFSITFNVETQDYLRGINSEEMRLLLNSLNDNNIIDDYIYFKDLSGLFELISYYANPSLNFKIELSYMEQLIVKNNNNFQTQANISFLRFFEDSVNLNSISIIDLSGNFLQTSVNNNFYKTTLSTISTKEYLNEVIFFENITLSVNESEAINESSIHFFINNEKTNIEVESFDYINGLNKANVSIKAIVPFSDSNTVIKGVLFFAVNETNFLEEYYTLPAQDSVDFFQTPVIKSKASEIIFKDSFNANEEKTHVLYYEINTNTNKDYTNLIVNDSNINVFLKNNHFDSSINFRSTGFENSESVKILSFFNQESCIINVKVQSYE